MDNYSEFGTKDQSNLIDLLKEGSRDSNSRRARALLFEPIPTGKSKKQKLRLIELGPMHSLYLRGVG